MNIRAIIGCASIIVATGMGMIGWGISADCRSQDRDKILWQRDEALKDIVWEIDKELRNDISEIKQSQIRMEAKL